MNVRKVAYFELMDDKLVGYFYENWWKYVESNVNISPKLDILQFKIRFSSFLTKWDTKVVRILIPDPNILRFPWSASHSDTSTLWISQL